MPRNLAARLATASAKAAGLRDTGLKTWHKLNQLMRAASNCKLMAKAVKAYKPKPRPSRRGGHNEDVTYYLLDCSRRPDAVFINPNGRTLH